MKINIPGLHNSDKDHWQSHFERLYPSEIKRVNQSNWDAPNCETWIEKIENDLISLNHSELILIGHSIGCMAIVKWYEKFRHKIKGALLVAPSDAERDDYPKNIKGFTPIPVIKLPFPSIVVASTNDFVTDMERSQEFATNWGSELIVLENAGHIESASGYGNWAKGIQLLNKLSKT